MSEASAAQGTVFEAVIVSVLDAVVAHASEAGGNTTGAVKALVLQTAARIELANAGRIVDAASAQWVTFCSHLLASYRTVAAQTGDSDAAIAVLTEAAGRPFAQQMTTYLVGRFGIAQDAPGEAFDRIAENFKTRGETRFGATFIYVQAVQDRDRSNILITKCFFNDFFAANNAPEVTPILCALDMVWAKELAHPRYGVHFERPTTLAAGDDACRFRFMRI